MIRFSATRILPQSASFKRSSRPMKTSSQAVPATYPFSILSSIVCIQLLTLPIGSEQTNGMHQYVMWTAFDAEGLGCNLQHYNPLIDVRLETEFNIPTTWSMKAQLVFGKPEGEKPGPKPKNELEKSLKVFGK